MTDAAALKRAAAQAALGFIKPGMRLGLGTGSTAEAFLELLGPKVAAGLPVIAVPTSQRTAAKAKSLGIPLGTLDELVPLDLTIDGADEADADLNLIKGGGGALLHEKIVAASSRAMIVIADRSKLVARLGGFPLPVEVLAFGAASTRARIAAALAQLAYHDVAITERRSGDGPFITDSGNRIFDLALKSITSAPALAASLSAIPGVAGHGLFIGMASRLIVAGDAGIEIIERKDA